MAKPEVHAVVDRQLGTEFGSAGGTGQRRYVLLESLLVLAKRKTLILGCVCLAALTAFLVVLLLPDTYTANAKALPQVQNHSLLLQLAYRLNSPLSPNLQSGQLFVAMLGSETVANHLIDRFSLMKVYDADLKVKARHILSSRTEIRLGVDGVISVSVDDHDPQRAADLTNGYLEELETLAKSLTKLQVTKHKDFLSKVVKAAAEEFAHAEQVFRQTEEGTSLVLPAPQTKVLIQQEANMHARVAAQEVNVQWLRSFATPENPGLVRAIEKLSALHNQERKLEIDHGGRPGFNMPLEKMPAAAMEYWRSFRELKFKEAFFDMLRRQLDETKLEETKVDLIIQPVVQVLDRAVLPERKSAPHRFLIVSAVTLLAMLLATVAAFMMERVGRARPQRRPRPPVQVYAYHLQQRPENTRKTG